MQEISPGLKELLKIKKLWKTKIEPRYKRTKVVNLNQGTLYINSNESHPIIKTKIKKDKQGIMETINKTLENKILELVEKGE